jgi:S1-C subfamily serine protease
MTIGSSDDLASAIDAPSPGDHVKVTVRSGGRASTAEVTLGNRPAATSSAG